MPCPTTPTLPSSSGRGYPGSILRSLKVPRRTTRAPTIPSTWTRGVCSIMASRLGIVRAFGAATSAPRANVIYFDLLGKTVVVYSSRMAIACLAAVLLLGAVAAVRASRSGKLRLVALIRGTLSSFLAIVGAVVVVTAVWRALTALNPAIEGLLHSFTTWMWCAITGTVVVAAGATAAFQRLMGETDHDRRTHGRRCDGGRAAGRLGNGMAATGELSGRMAAGRSGVGVARSVETAPPCGISSFSLKRSLSLSWWRRSSIW